MNKLRTEEKICGICHTSIDDSKEYCEFIHLEKKDKVKSKGYYHVKCFRDRIKGTELQNAVAGKAMEILEKIGVRV